MVVGENDSFDVVRLCFWFLNPYVFLRGDYTVLNISDQATNGGLAGIYSISTCHRNIAGEWIRYLINEP